MDRVDDLVVFDDHLPRTPSPAATANSHIGAESPLQDLGRHDAIWYVHLPDGQRWGPAAPESLLQWLSQGMIPPTALVWRNNWPEWKYAAAVFERPQIERPPAQTAPPAELIAPVEAVEFVNSAVPSYGTYRRIHRYPSAMVTFVLIGLLVILFSLMLYVFVLRDSHPRHTALIPTKFSSRNAKSLPLASPKLPC